MKVFKIKINNLNSWGQKKYLYIGAVPDQLNNHPGGQATSANGLFQYCLKKK